MDLTAAIDQARDLQASIMTDVVVLEVEDGWTVDDLGTRTDVWTTIYGGTTGLPGLVQTLQNQPREVDSAGVPVTVETYACKLPYAVTLPQGKRAQVRVLASHDPANVGTYTVLADPTQGWVTCRRLICARAS